MRHARYYRLFAAWSALLLAPAFGSAQKAPAASVKPVGSVWSWDIATGHTVPSANTVPQTALYAWSSDGAVQAVAVGTEIQVTNRDHGTAALSIKASYGEISALAISGAGNQLAVATSQGYLGVWNDLRSAPMFTNSGSTAEIGCLAFSANGELLVSGGRSLDVWESRGLKAHRPSVPLASYVTAVAYGPSDELTVGDFSGHLHLFNAAGESTSDILAASGSVTAVSYSPDGSLMAAGGTDGVVKVWNGDRNAPSAVLTEQGRVLAVRFHPNNSVVAIATSGNQVSTWDIASRRRLRRLPVGDDSVAGMMFMSNDLLSIGLQVAPPPRVATLHVLVLLGGPRASGEHADAERADAVAIADAVQKSGRGVFGLIDQQRLPIESGLDVNAVRDALQAIAKDSHPEDSLFVYYAGPSGPDPKRGGGSLIFADGGAVTLTQLAHWLDDVAATTETVVFDTPGASAAQDSLRAMLVAGAHGEAAEHRSRLFVAFNRQETQTAPGERAASAAMLIAGLAGQADQYPKDGRVTAAELRTFLDQRTLSAAASGFEGKYELDGKDFPLVAQRSTRGVSVEAPSRIVRNETIFQKRHDYALLIATNDYDSWPKLTNPNQDAEAIEAVLRDKYGFQVELLKDQTQAQIYETLTRYQKKEYQPGDQLLIFVAGHGDFDENEKEGFLVARDSKLPSVDTIRSTLIPHSRLRSYIDNIPVNHALVILDVCFGGTFDRGIADASARGGMYEDQSVDKLFVERAQYTTRKFITSGGKVYVPDGEPGHNSPFVHNLLTELRNPSKDRGYLTFADLLSAVGPTQPAPVWGTWGKDGAGSDFFLISRNAKPVTRTEVSRDLPRPESLITPRLSVCFVGLKNLSGDLSAAVWGDAITEQMTSGLGAGQKLHVVSSEDVGRLKRSLALEDLSSYSRETLLTIRQNTGADLVIAGNFIAAKEAGGLLRVSFTIQNATSGQTMDTLAVTGTEASIDDLIGRANVLLLSKLGVSNLSAEQLAEVKAGMPTTAEALKDYSEAMVLLHKGDAQSARDLLLKADAVEPGVAFVHRGLADVWQALGYDKKAVEEAGLAAKLAAGLPKEDLYSMQARESFLSGQLPRAIDRYRYLTMTQPDNLEYGLDLARAESYAGRGKDALVNLADLVNLPAPFGGDPRVLIEEADAYKSLGEFPKVAEAAHQAQVAAAERGARLLEAEADWEYCWAQRNLGDSDSAVAACRQALDIYQRVGDKLGMARSQSGIGTALYDKSDYVGALSLYRMAAGLTESIGARTDRADALQNIAKTQIALGQLAEAEASLAEMTALAKEVGASKEERDSYFFRSDVAHTRGDMAKAQEYVADALRLAEEAGDEDAIARAYSFQATYGLEAGSLRAALASADRCIEIRTKIQLRTGVAFCQQTRGDILLAENRIADAQSSYQAATKIYEEIKQPGDTAGVWLSQAELHAETGSPAEGEALARKAALEYANEKDVEMQASALSELLHSLVAQGKQSEAEKISLALGKLDPKDPDTRSEVEIAEARYRAMAGTYDVALEKIARSLDFCKQRGRVDCELQVRLLDDEIRLKAGKRDGLDAELRALVEESSRLEFNLIAADAGRMLTSLTAHAAQ